MANNEISYDFTNGTISLTTDSGTKTLDNVTDITSGNIPYVNSGALADSPLSTDGDNVGLGAPAIKAWASAHNVMQLGGVGAVSGADGTGGGLILWRNAYIDDGGNKYQSSDEASQIELDANGQIVFRVAPSGTADATITWTTAMTISSGGTVNNGTFSATGATRGTAQYGTELRASSANTTTSSPHLQFYNPNGQVGSVSTSASATTYATSSDYRLKANYTRITNGIDRVKRIPVYRGEFKAEPGRAVDYFIAHELAAHIPEAVTGEKDAVDDNGSPIYQGVDQSKVVPLLTAALQQEIAKREGLASLLVAKGVITQAEADSL